MVPAAPINTLFLNDEDRKPIEAAPIANKVKAKAQPNLAIYHDDVLDEVVAGVLRMGGQFYEAFQTNWTNQQQNVWEPADEMYWMALKEHRLSELTRAKVSASVFHRVCRRLADGAFLASFTEEMPVKFFPDIGVFEDSENKKRKATVAEALNRWASYCMRKTCFESKARSSYHSVFKYGDHIAYVPYDYEVEKRKRWVEKNPNEMISGLTGEVGYKHTETGEISNTPHPMEMEEEEYDYVCKDHVGFHPIKVDQCWLDNRISDLDRQTCFLYRSDMTRGEIVNKCLSGQFINFDKITQMQKFNPYSTANTVEMERIENAGKGQTDSELSEMYEHWQMWILLPRIKVKVNSKGKVTSMKWDQNAQPRRYLMETIGDINSNNAVVVRFQESPYWGDGIPFIAAHSHEDDSGFYHRGLVGLTMDNYIQETVAKGQLMDNRTLQNMRPMCRMIGRVKNKDMKMGYDKVFDVTSQDAIRQLDVPDITQNIMPTLQYLESDSEKVGQTPPFALGEALGGRTSATEFATIRDQSSAPALNDIKQINMQLFGGYMKKLKEYAPQFLDKDIAVQVAGPEGEQATFMITADEFNADMMLKEVSVQEFENKSTVRQILLNMTQILFSPAIAPFINPIGYLTRIFKAFSTVFPNPEEILNKDENVQQLMKAYLAQAPADAPQAGAPGLQAQPGALGEGAPEIPIGVSQLTGPLEAQIPAGIGGQGRGI